MQERSQIDEGESQEEEAGGEQHWDDTNLHTKGGPVKGLKSFRGSGHWDDESDSECISSNNEEEEDKKQFWCALVSTSRQECVGLTH